MLKAAMLTKAKREFRPEEVQAHAKTYRKTADEFGLSVFARNFWQVMSCEELFPEAALIRRYIMQEAGSAPPAGQKDRTCGKCQNGWVVAYYNQRKMPMMRRCECLGGAAVDWEEQKKGAPR